VEREAARIVFFDELVLGSWSFSELPGPNRFNEMPKWMWRVCALEQIKGENYIFGRLSELLCKRREGGSSGV
jgi:hypothetical protein